MIMPCFFRRVAEFTLSSVIVSLFFGLFYEELSNAPTLFTIMMCICLAIVIGINVYMLRSYFFFVKNKFDYFTVNIIAYVVSMIINLTMYYFCSPDVAVLPQIVYQTMYFSFLFFASFGVSVLTSTLFVHGIIIIVIFLAPLELYGVMSRMKRVVKPEDLIE